MINMLKNKIRCNKNILNTSNLLYVFNVHNLFKLKNTLPLKAPVKY